MNPNDDHGDETEQEINYRKKIEEYCNENADNWKYFEERFNHDWN